MYQAGNTATSDPTHPTTFRQAFHKPQPHIRAYRHRHAQQPPVLARSRRTTSTAPEHSIERGTATEAHKAPQSHLAAPCDAARKMAGNCGCSATARQIGDVTARCGDQKCSRPLTRSSARTPRHKPDAQTNRRVDDGDLLQTNTR